MDCDPSQGCTFLFDLGGYLIFIQPAGANLEWESAGALAMAILKQLGLMETWMEFGFKSFYRSAVMESNLESVTKEGFRHGSILVDSPRTGSGKVLTPVGSLIYKLSV